MPEQVEKSRPLSPHIQIYRWTLPMALSILHRATGVALYVGTLLLVWWLLAAASGPAAFAQVQELAATWVGRLVLFGYSWALFHHMVGGLRHFIWDAGWGFELSQVKILAWVSAVLPLLLTLITWGLVFYAGAA